MPLESGVSLTLLAGKTERMTGADIQFICQKAKMCAIREIIDNKEASDTAEILVTEKHFEEAIEVVIHQNENIIN